MAPLSLGWLAGAVVGGVDGAGFLEVFLREYVLEGRADGADISGRAEFEDVGTLTGLACRKDLLRTGILSVTSLLGPILGLVSVVTRCLVWEVRSRAV